MSNTPVDRPIRIATQIGRGVTTYGPSKPTPPKAHGRPNYSRVEEVRPMTMLRVAVATVARRLLEWAERQPLQGEELVDCLRLTYEARVPKITAPVVNDVGRRDTSIWTRGKR